MKRLPQVLVLGLILEALSSVTFLILLARDDVALSQTWTVVMNGIDVAAHVLVAAGAFQLARSLAGRAALGAKIAAIAQLVLVAMVAFWITAPVWGTGQAHVIDKVFMAEQYVHSIVWLGVAVGFALVARTLALQIALPIVAVVGIPVPVLGRALYAHVRGITGLVLELLPYIVVSLLALAAVWSRRADVTEAPGSDPADAFTRASKALWLRVIAALSLAGFTFLVGMARAQDLLGLLRAVMLLAPIVDAIALVLFARAVIGLARTSLAPWLLSAAAAFALAATGMIAGQVVQLYELFYGRHDGGLYGMAREPMLGGFSTQVVPLIAATAIGLVLVAVARLARERNAEDIRENVVVRTGVFVGLMIGSMLMLHFITGSAVDAPGLAVFLMLAIAAATLYALTIAAKLCAQGAELVARDPVGLPAAKLVST